MATTVTQYYYDIELLMAYWKTYLLKLKFFYFNGHLTSPCLTKRDQMITDILRIQPDGPKSVRDYNLKNQCKVLKIGKENKYNLIGQV
ncbi:hypothetical protein T11_7306 [Trichinella zimbabwensis]|uniref:Uncharacterized protein n=1 Tax=Trichinella zimbabwensis TaxID=268475 RepID=A0A0V1GDC2_9BILA|nr:hypothetical protein T11_7306 [Trichinella zimbabwensis]